MRRFGLATRLLLPVFPPRPALRVWFTATVLVQASTQRTKVVIRIAENPVNEPNNRTQKYKLERVTSDCGTRGGREFEPRRSPFSEIRSHAGGDVQGAGELMTRHDC